MDNPFFEQPILNSPYAGPSRHWELDAQGQPTQKIIQTRRPAEFITPIPQPKKRKGQPQQQDLLFDEGQGLSSQNQRYAHTAIINGVREQVDRWRLLPEHQWRVTPETARLMKHWRHHPFSGIRFYDQKVFVVQTGFQTIQRCVLMTTDPGDLVLDPTCGSGTTATVAEQWGGRWITIDTSRVALALARARIMGARYPYYLLADSKAGQPEEPEVTPPRPQLSPPAAISARASSTSGCHASR